MPKKLGKKRENLKIVCLSLGLFLSQVNRLKLNLVKELVSLENEIEQIKFAEKYC